MAYTYIIKHLPTNQVYYGVRTANTVSPHDDLWKEYFTSSTKVHALIDQFGKDSFITEVRKTFDNPQKAVDWELKVLKRCKVLEDNRWLNANIGGYIIPTPASRAKISAFHKDKPKSEEHKQKIAHANRGKKKGPLSDETKAKISVAKSGSNNPMYGRPRTEELKQRQSEAMKGRPSPLKGRKFDDELHKGGRKNKGKIRTQEQKDRISAGLKAKGYKRERLICPHCGNDVAVNIFARYHGDRCKFKS